MPIDETGFFTQATLGSFRIYEARSKIGGFCVYFIEPERNTGPQFSICFRPETPGFEELSSWISTLRLIPHIETYAAKRDDKAGSQ